MKNLWRVVIVVLLAGAVVAAVNLKGGKEESPATNAAVVKEKPVPSAAKAPKPDDPKSCGATCSVAPVAEPEKTDEADKTEKPSVKAEEPEKKPEAAKPAKVAAPAKPKGLPKIVDVGGENCIPCRLMIPVLDELRSEHKGKLEVVVISKDKDPGALKRYRVSTIPTQILYDADGKEIARHFGFFAKDEVIDTFKKHGIEL